jgi:hypothetical protein
MKDIQSKGEQAGEKVLTIAVVCKEKKKKKERKKVFTELSVAKKKKRCKCIDSLLFVKKKKEEKPCLRSNENLVGSCLPTDYQQNRNSHAVNKKSFEYQLLNNT